MNHGTTVKGITHYTENNFNIIPYINKVNYPIPVFNFLHPMKKTPEIYTLFHKDIRFVQAIDPIEKLNCQNFKEILHKK